MGQLDQEVFIPKTFADKPTPEALQAEQELMPRLLRLLADPRIQLQRFTREDYQPGWGQACLAALLLDPDLMGESTIPLLKVLKYLYQKQMNRALDIFFLRIQRHLRPFAIKQGWIKKGESIDFSSMQLMINLKGFIEESGFNYLVPSAGELLGREG